MRYGVQVPLSDGTVVCLDVAAPGENALSAERLFEEASRVIAADWITRKETGSESSRWLQVVCYQLLQLTIDNGFQKLFDERIARYGRNSRGKKVATNLFQRGMLALFAHEDRYVLDEGERAHFGKRLWYAYRHYVPHYFMLGFLREVWNDEAPAHSGTAYVEPAYAEWVYLQRAQDEAPERRGEYPPELEQNVATARKLLPLIGDHEQRLARFREQGRLRLEKDEFR